MASPRIDAKKNPGEAAASKKKLASPRASPGAAPTLTLSFKKAASLPGKKTSSGSSRLVNKEDKEKSTRAKGKGKESKSKIRNTRKGGNQQEASTDNNVQEEKEAAAPVTATVTATDKIDKTAPVSTAMVDQTKIMEHFQKKEEEETQQQQQQQKSLLLLSDGAIIGTGSMDLAAAAKRPDGTIPENEALITAPAHASAVAPFKSGNSVLPDSHRLGGVLQSPLQLQAVDKHKKTDTIPLPGADAAAGEGDGMAFASAENEFNDKAAHKSSTTTTITSGNQKNTKNELAMPSLTPLNTDLQKSRDQEVASAHAHVHEVMKLPQVALASDSAAAVRREPRDGAESELVGILRTLKSEDTEDVDMPLFSNDGGFIDGNGNGGTRAQKPSQAQTGMATAAVVDDGAVVSADTDVSPPLNNMSRSSAVGEGKDDGDGEGEMAQPSSTDYGTGNASDVAAQEGGDADIHEANELLPSSGYAAAVVDDDGQHDHDTQDGAVTEHGVNGHGHENGRTEVATDASSPAHVGVDAVFSSGRGSSGGGGGALGGLAALIAHLEDSAPEGIVSSSAAAAVPTLPFPLMPLHHAAQEEDREGPTPDMPSSSATGGADAVAAAAITNAMEEAGLAGESVTLAEIVADDNDEDDGDGEEYDGEEAEEEESMAFEQEVVEEEDDDNEEDGGEEDDDSDSHMMQSPAASANANKETQGKITSSGHKRLLDLAVEDSWYPTDKSILRERRVRDYSVGCGDGDGGGDGNAAQTQLHLQRGKDASWRNVPPLEKRMKVDPEVRVSLVRALA
jgi:hypothetical protein